MAGLNVFYSVGDDAVNGVSRRQRRFDLLDGGGGYSAIYS